MKSFRGRGARVHYYNTTGQDILVDQIFYVPNVGALIATVTIPAGQRGACLDAGVHCRDTDGGQYQLGDVVDYHQANDQIVPAGQGDFALGVIWEISDEGETRFRLNNRALGSNY